jgi:hypothetical protein
LDHVLRGACRTFINGIREQSIKWQLLLGGRRILSEALRQTLKLEVINLAVGSPVRLPKTSDRTLRRSQPLPKRKKRW